MTNPLYVPANEFEKVRVFALDLPAAKAEAFIDDRPANGQQTRLAQALGTLHVDTDHVEVFPASDLKGIGLSGYLVEGIGISADDIAPDANMLDDEDGYVIVVHSAAFGGEETRLTPERPVRHLGTYRLAQAEPPEITFPNSIDEPSVASPQEPEPLAPSRVPRSLALVGLLAAAVLLLVLAYAFGGLG
ncbi:hypothetical protein [Pseudoruegeria sp. HB172150]|uniref:hypothetical protein n=1 Tax=Pseudoruegeria sp. HB172150 TaxID=2721164 RepID=UPI001553ABEB|nr:hypothetical protein [Pseudoruegeria sp. HB172150]